MKTIVLFLFVISYTLCFNVFTWGYNNLGQLGIGDQTNQRSLVPTPINYKVMNYTDSSGEVVFPTARLSCAGGYHTVIYTSNDEVWAFGDNTRGQLGIGTSSIQRSYDPVKVNFTNIKVDDLQCGEYFTVLLSDNVLYSWGRHEFGILGTGQMGGGGQRMLTPVKVRMSGVLQNEKVAKIATGQEFTLLLTESGKLVSWGRNDKGQLGDGTQTNRPEPVLVIMNKALQDKKVVEISAGYKHAAVVTEDGRVYVWGSNEYGQLGNGKKGNNEVILEPTEVTSPLFTQPITHVSAGSRHTVVRDYRGRTFAWGSNSYGELGDRTIEERLTPVESVNIDDIIFEEKQIIKSIHAGDQNTHVITDLDHVYGWGLTDQGQLGEGGQVPRVIGNKVARKPDAFSEDMTITGFSKGHKHCILQVASASKMTASLLLIVALVFLL